MDFTKIDQAYLDFLSRELSNGGLGIAVALTVFQKSFFCRIILNVQSSYIDKTKKLNIVILILKNLVKKVLGKINIARSSIQRNARTLHHSPILEKHSVRGTV